MTIIDTEGDTTALVQISDDDDEEQDLQPSALAGVVAGIVRPVLGGAAILIVGTAKSALQWFFRVPVKLFRPSAVNPWFVFQSMAVAQGRQMSVDFVRQTVRQEGSILATPLETVQKMINPVEMVEHRHLGVRHLAQETIQNAMPATFKERMAFVYRNLPFNAFRDAGGFALFFGVFELMRFTGSKLVSDYFDEGRSKRRFFFFRQPEKPKSVQHIAAQSFVTVASGALAGASFQLFTYPLDRLGDAQMAQATKTVSGSHASALTLHGASRSTLVGALRLIREHGLSPWFKGISAQVVRAVPASAAALLVYDIAGEHFGDYST
eukprot:jgi/Hompol1/5947/HPOL_000912-RA